MALLGGFPGSPLPEAATMSEGGGPARPAVSAGVRRHLVAALGMAILTLGLGGCTSMTPERCGAKARAANPPPVSVRCSYEF
jgi:hypothetical protein